MRQAALAPQADPMEVARRRRTFKPRQTAPLGSHADPMEVASRGTMGLLALLL